ncbi:hypothetical protein M405DRAFT_936543 [Rhizopogon salebrosus TDB-379]|nr:hypothetical protein M405DRAFT_936543 [Rhizopogon salebrosus TDB-379]
MVEMEKDTADCVPLLEITTSALGEEAMQMLLISTQRTNMALCVKVLIIYIGKARKWSSVWLSKDTCIEMQEKIAAWFPHMKVRQNIHCME